MQAGTYMPICVSLYPQAQNSFWHIVGTRCWMKEWIHLKSQLAHSCLPCNTLWPVSSGNQSSIAYLRSLPFSFLLNGHQRKTFLPELHVLGFCTLLLSYKIFIYIDCTHSDVTYTLFCLPLSLNIITLLCEFLYSIIRSLWGNIKQWARNWLWL